MNDETRKEIEKLLRSLEGRTLLVPGSRNNDTVNVCILDWVTNGFTDDEDAFVERVTKTLIKFDYDKSELDYFDDKAHTVHIYLTGWGPEGYEASALDYVI